MSPASTINSPTAVSTAFGSAILSVSPSLRNFALRLTNDHSAADDLVQDTLVRAWAARSRFEPGSNAKAWLFRIARNSFLSGLRRTRRQVAWDPDRHHLLLVQEPTQHDALHERDLRIALSRLTPEQRGAFLLVTQQGMTFADAAAELGIPPGTVKSRVSRARNSLLAHVGGDDGANERQTMPEAGHPVSRRSLVACSEENTADRCAASRYAEWKASGATSIG